MMTNNFNIEESNFEELFANVKAKDEKNKKLMHRMYYLYLFLSVMYIPFVLIDRGPETSGLHRFAFLLMIIAFLLFALIFRKHYRTLTKVDYASPVLEVLRKSVIRFSFWTRDLLLTLLISLLVDVSVTIIFAEIFTKYYDLWTCVFIIQVIYFLIIALTLFFSYLYWKRHNRPLLLNILRLIDSMTE